MSSLFTLDPQITHAMESFGDLKKNTVTSKNFKDDLAITIQRYKNLLDAFGKLNATDLQKFADRIYATKNNIPNMKEGKACQIYAEITTAVKSSNDSKVAFSDMNKTAKNILNVLNNFYANANIVFDGKDTISVQNAKLSHISAMGFIEKAQTFLDYQVSLLNTITYEIVNRNGVSELAPIAPYRYKFLDDFKQTFIDFYSKMSNGKHSVYLSQYKKLKKSKDDVFIGTAQGGSNLAYLSDTAKADMDKNLFGTWSLNPFRWLGEMYNLYRHNKYVKMGAEREDLMAHVALLQLELSEKNPNSEEYAKAVKVIDSYNQMIAELDRKLEAYYNEAD